MIKLLVFLLCISFSAWLYRAGGKGKPYNTKYRDVCCPLVLLGLVIALFGLKMAFWWAYAICFGLSWAVLTTYWDFLFKYDNFYAHGLGCGLAGIPLIWVGVPLHYILIRIVICSVGMGLWSKWIGNDVSEEMGRGVLFII